MRKKNIAFSTNYVNQLAATSFRFLGRSIVDGASLGEFVRIGSSVLSKVANDEQLAQTMETLFWTWGVMTPSLNLYNGLTNAVPIKEVAQVIGSNLGRYYGGQLTAEAVRTQVHKHFPENASLIMPWVEAVLDVGAAALFPNASIQADGSQYWRSYSINRGLIQHLDTMEGTHIAIDANGATVALGNATEISLENFNGLPPEIQLVDNKLVQVSYQDDKGRSHHVFLLQVDGIVKVYSKNRVLSEAIMTQNGLAQEDESTGLHSNSGLANNLYEYQLNTGKYQSLLEKLGEVYPSQTLWEFKSNYLSLLSSDTPLSDEKAVNLKNILAGTGVRSVAEGARPMASIHIPYGDVSGELKQLFKAVEFKHLRVLYFNQLLYVYNEKLAIPLWQKHKKSIPDFTFNKLGWNKTFENFLKTPHRNVLDIELKEKDKDGQAQKLEAPILKLNGLLYGYRTQSAEVYSGRDLALYNLDKSWKKNFPNQRKKFWEILNGPERQQYDARIVTEKIPELAKSISDRTKVAAVALPFDEVVSMLAAVLIPPMTAIDCQVEGSKVDNHPGRRYDWYVRRFSSSPEETLNSAQAHICAMPEGKEGPSWHLSANGLHKRR